jgi:putative membrane protein
MVRPSPTDWSVADVVADSLGGLPYYLANFGVALLLLTAALAIYAFLTSAREISLARQGQGPAAISYSGVVLGFALPLASVLASAGSLLELLAWSVVALGVQLVIALVLRRVLKVAPPMESADQISGGLLHGALVSAVGLINAAAVAL